MGSPVEDAEQAIRELSGKHQAGEITAEAFREQSLPYAAIIADARDAEQAAQRAQADRWRDVLVLAVEYAERDPVAVQAAVAGLIHGLGHYLRSRPASE